MSNSDNSKGGCCGLLIFHIVLGWFFVDYSLWSILHKNLPFWADYIIGLFLGGAFAGLSLLCWILRVFGLETPFLG
jgi:hypothetical protein